jgi:hypothetical protein
MVYVAALASPWNGRRSPATTTLCLVILVSLSLFARTTKFTKVLLTERTAIDAFKLIDASTLPLCKSNDIIDIVKSSTSTAADVNKFRRELMIHNQECFQEHAHLFKEHFISRLALKQLMLHIPKAGGSSICEASRRPKSKFGHNCHEQFENFCPLWCCCERRKSTSCDQLKKTSETAHIEFIMTENALDAHFCDEFTYSALLREPVSHAMSQTNAFLNWVKKGSKKEPPITISRLQLASQNYQTWALSAGTDPEMKECYETKPWYDCVPIGIERRHLEIAKSKLISMDYIVDLGYHDKHCLRKLFTKLKIGNETTGEVNTKHETKTVSTGRKYSDYFDTATYTSLNNLDIELYKFAGELMDVDCIFIQSL